MSDLEDTRCEFLVLDSKFRSPVITQFHQGFPAQSLLKIVFILINSTSTITTKLQTMWRQKSAWELKATYFEIAMKHNPYMKMNKKAAEVLWLISATPFLDATQQDSMLRNSTKFKLSAQGWPWNFSSQPVQKPGHLPMSNMGFCFHSVFPDEERGSEFLFVQARFASGSKNSEGN